MPTHFKLPLHHAFVLQHGEALAWSRASKCPCGITVDPNRVRPSCKVCQGLGFQYDDPQTIIGLVTGMQHQKTLLQIGIAMMGDLLLGLSPYDFTQISDWDRFRFLQRDRGTPYDGDTRVRDGNEAFDVLTYEVKAVHTCFSIDPQSQVKVPYLQGTDFTIDGRVITWLPSRGPRARQKYSIKYHAAFDWIAFVTPMNRYDGGESIGDRALLRKRHLASVVNPTP